MPATMPNDRMKTVMLDRVDGQSRFRSKLLDCASNYGFVPRVCHPYRAQTEGAIESTVRYIKSSFWQRIAFDLLQESNRQALVWCGETKRSVHATTREVPLVRYPQEGSTPLNGQRAYDIGYVSTIRWRRTAWRPIAASATRRRTCMSVLHTASPIVELFPVPESGSTSPLPKWSSGRHPSTTRLRGGGPCRCSLNACLTACCGCA